MLDDQLPELDRLVKERYGVLVAEFDGFDRELLPDFRDHRGVSLQKLGIVLGPEDIGDLGAPTGNLQARAEGLVTATINAMRMGVVGAGLDGPVTLCFLEGHELPAVHWKVPPHTRGLEVEGQDPAVTRAHEASVKLRHVFAVRHP